MNSVSSKLEKLTQNVFQGLKTSMDKVYIVDLVAEKDGKYLIYSKQTEKEHWIDKALAHPLIKGGETKRFRINNTDKLIVFPYILDDSKMRILTEKEFKKISPLTFEYFELNRKDLENREKGKMKHEKWFGYIYPKSLGLMGKKKIVTPDYYESGSFGYDDIGDKYFCGGGAGGYGIIPKDKVDPYYLMGILNSRVSDWFIKKTSVRAYQTAHSYVKKFINEIPIPDPFSKTGATTKEAKEIASISKKLKEAYSKNNEVMQLELEKKLNILVYKLYKLTDSDITELEKSFNIVELAETEIAA